MSSEIGSASKIKGFGDIGINIQEEIIKWLPVKSIVQFRCVCKAWKCLIDSSYFIASHTARQYQRQHLLLPYSVGEEAFPRFVSIVDDETFPQLRFVKTLPLSNKQLTWSNIVGSCNGLLCFHGSHYDPDSRFTRTMAMLWNPSIRKSITITVPGISHEIDKSALGFGVSDKSALGFGVSPVSNDPMIVRVIQLSYEKTSEFNHPWDVMVYSLSSGKWRRPSSSSLPSKSIQVECNSVVIDKLIYWFGVHLRAIDGKIDWRLTCNLIMSFDMTNDTFKVIELPHSLAHHTPNYVYMSLLRESIVMLACNWEKDVCDVWTTDNGAQRLFIKLFTINHDQTPLGFRKNGAPIFQVNDCPSEKAGIVVYEPNSYNSIYLEIHEAVNVFAVKSYMETLLLLGRSDCTGY